VCLQLLDIDVDLVNLDLPDVNEHVRVMGRVSPF
jgi:hypothetical protein